MLLFFYGTLMDREVVAAVIGRIPTHVIFKEGELDGHALCRAKGYSFPILIPRRQSSIKGVCAQGLTKSDLDRIRYFEDVEYELRAFQIAVEGRLLEAHAFCPNHLMRASDEPWDFEEWQRKDKALLLAITKEVFIKHYGNVQIDRIDPLWHEIHARHKRARKPAMRRARRRIA